MNKIWMKLFLGLGCLAVTSFLLFSDFALAKVPRQMYLQAKLTNKQGENLTGSHSVKFRLYSAESGGEALWTETQGLTVSNDGIFGAYLGSVTELPESCAFDTTYWVSLEIDGDGEMTPRIKLVAAPYSLNTYVVRSDQDAVFQGNITVSHIYGSSSAAGSLTLESTSDSSKGDVLLNPSGGAVGIGTADPSGILDVRGGNVAFWTGAGTNTNASSSGELYVEGDIEVDGNVYLGDSTSDNFTVTGVVTHIIKDNSSDSFVIQQGTSDYLNVDTSDDAEAVTFGNTTTNPKFIFIGAGNVGLGTSTPSARLNLAESATEAGGVLFGTDTNLYRSAANTLKTDGNLTIGGTLEVSGELSFSGDLDMQNNLILNIGDANTDFDNTGGVTSLSLSGDLNVNGGDIGSSSALNIASSAGAITLTPAADSGLNVVLSGTGDLAVNTSQLYADTSSGYIGIGTSVPDALLDVRKSAVAAGDIASFGDTTSGKALVIGQGASAAYAYLSNTAGTPQLVLKGGKVAIGADDPGSYTLYVNGDTYLGGLTVTNGGLEFGGALDMKDNLITNIGDEGTDFTAGGGLTLAGALNADGGLAVDTDKFTVADTTGDTSIGGTLGVSGAATLSSTLDVTGATGIDGNFDVNTDKFTVDAASGNTSVAGTLGVTGATTLSSTLGVSGGTTLSSTLGVTGAATLGSTLGVTGATTLSSTLDVTGAAGIDGNFDINTNKFTVAAATGNTTIAGSLSVGGGLSFGSDLDMQNNLITNIGDANTDFTAGGGLNLAGVLNADGGIAVDTNKFTVADSTGNTSIAGTLGVSGNTTLSGDLGVSGSTTLSGTLGVSGAATLSSTLDVTGATGIDGNLDVNTDKFTVAAASGNTVVGGTLGVSGAATLSSTLGVSGATTLSSTLDVSGATGIDGNFDVNTNKFTVAASNGNTAVGGTLDVSGAAVLSSTLGVSGNATLSADIAVNGGDITSTSALNITSSGGAITITPNAGTNLNMVLADAGDLAVNTNQLYVDTSNGYVGVGTTVPNARLELNTQARATAFDAANSVTWTDLALFNPTDTLNAAAGISFQVDNIFGGGPGAGIAGVKTDAADSKMDLVFITDAAGGSSAERMRITSTGNVGIGTDDPGAYKLYVNGDTYLGGLTVTDGALEFGGALDMRNNLITNIGNASTDFTAGGGLDLAGALNVTGATGIDGNFDVNTDKFTVAAASGNTAVAGTLGVTGAATLGSTLGVTGAATLGSTLDVTGATGIDGNFDINTDKFTVAAATGNTAVAGTLGVTGAASLSNTLDVTGAATLWSTLGVSGAASLSSTLGVTGITTLSGVLNADGGIAVDTDKFTVADTTGNTAIGGTLGVTGAATLSSSLDVSGATGIDGNFDINTNKFTVAAASGNTAVGGTLGVTGAATLSSSLDVSGATGIDGNFDINTDKFTVAAASGNTAVAGTLTATGATVLNGGLTMDTDKFTVADTTGNTTIAGTLGVTGEATLSGGLSVTGNVTVSGNVDGRDVSVDGDKLDLLSFSAEGSGGGLDADTLDGHDTSYFQASDSDLTAIAALSSADGNLIVGSASGWVAESGATVRTSLGLGSIATQASDSVSITGGSISGITDLAVADGGTGASDASTARSNLGLVIGTNVLAPSGTLTGLVQSTAAGTSYITGGSVGIGTNGPEHKLTVQTAGNNTSVTSAYTNSAIRIVDTNSAVGARWGLSWAKGDSVSTTIAAIEPEVSSGWPTDLKFLTNTDGATQISEKMRITAAGNVGIGTTSPTGRLDVRGDEARVWTGAGTANFATGAGDLYIEDNLEVDSTAYFSTDATIYNDIISKDSSEMVIWADGGVHIYLDNNNNDANQKFAIYSGNGSGGGTERFSVYESGAVWAGATLSQVHTDLAERMTVGEDMESGDVVAVDPNHDETVIKSNSGYQTTVIGIVSTKPGVLLGKEGPNDDDPSKQAIALAGRVPCKVSSMNGPIRNGDLLTTSPIPGVAMKAAEPWKGGIIGTAMQEFNGGADEIGKIVVFVNIQAAPSLPPDLIAKLSAGE